MPGRVPLPGCLWHKAKPAFCGLEGLGLKHQEQEQVLGEESASNAQELTWINEGDSSSETQGRSQAEQSDKDPVLHAE